MLPTCCIFSPLGKPEAFRHEGGRKGERIPPSSFPFDCQRDSGKLLFQFEHRLVGLEPDGDHC